MLILAMRLIETQLLYRLGAYLILHFLFIILFSSCTSEQTTEKQYLFLGHPYNWKNPYQVDPRLETLDYEPYSQIWLGGDVCSRTTEKESTLIYLDSLFHIGNPTTHWTLGNHDIQDGHIDWITNRTQRPTFYVDWVDGICLLVLNTNLFWHYGGQPAQVDCDQKMAQSELIHAVLDTIDQASHLVILHHLALFSELMKDSLGNPLELFNVNAPRIRMDCDSASYLKELIYPKLEQVKSKGIEIVLVGGDFGMRAKELAYQTPEDIWLLGSGINNSVSRSNVPDYVTTLAPDKVLIFKHWPESRKLEWNFVELNKLAGTKEEN